jgi:hypothetical protein
VSPGQQRLARLSTSAHLSVHALARWNGEPVHPFWSPGRPGSPSVHFNRQVERESLAHVPDEAGWRTLMQPVHDSLCGCSGDAGDAGGHVSFKVNPAAALQEFVMNGQEGLDDLLAALDGGSQVGRPGRAGVCRRIDGMAGPPGRFTGHAAGQPRREKKSY